MKHSHIIAVVPLLAIMLSSCGKYQSRIEAKIGCDKWAAEGGVFYIRGFYSIPLYERFDRLDRGLGGGQLLFGATSTRFISYCEEDTITRKYLGFTHTNRRRGEKVDIPCDKTNLDCAINVVLDEGEIVKRFAY